jgi:hypothetical protein
LVRGGRGEAADEHRPREAREALGEEGHCAVSRGEQDGDRKFLTAPHLCRSPNVRRSGRSVNDALLIYRKHLHNQINLTLTYSLWP